MRALRSLSISSQTSQLSNASDTDLASPLSERRRSTLRKLNPYGKGKEDLVRRPSKASSEDYNECTSNSTRPTTPSGSGSQGTSISGDASTILKSGPLQEETSLLKNKREYVVLTPVGLYKFKNRSAATEQFPQVSVPTSAIEALSPVNSVASFKDLGAGAEVHIPLEKVVSVFRDEGTKPCFGIEVWWKDSSPASAFTSIELNFALPGDRDDWLKEIQHAVKQRMRVTLEERTPSDVEIDLVQILEAKYPQQGAHLDIFPVVPRRPYTRLMVNSGEVKRGWREGSSFYLAFSKNTCLLAQFTRSPSGQRINPSIVQFGLAALSKVSASRNDERFDLIFRLPLDRPSKLELSSRHQRNVLSRFFRADTFLKPAWPLWTRREIFVIEGESQKIPLPEGDDYGGFKRTLEAFLEAYHSASVEWKVNWRDVKHAPEFQLLPPPSGKEYTAYQLLAVFRALRFNDFFKSLSFRGVSFEALSHVFDNTYRFEPTVWLSRTGKRSLTRDEFEVAEKSSILFQEVVAMLLGSESIRHVDFSDVLPKASRRPTTEVSTPSLIFQGCDIVPPIILLVRSLQTRCKSVVLNGNALDATDISELYQTFQSHPDCMKGLSFSRCQLDEMANITLWEGIHEQRHSLETLELSNNLSCLEAGRVSQTLRESSKLRRLDMAYCLKGHMDGPLFRPWNTSPYSDAWRLEEVNLSGWKINFDTITAFLRYMESEESNSLRQLALNHCGISGEVATAIFCRIGKGRDIHLHLNSNPLEDGSTDWIDLIHGNEAPKRLHLDMIQFRHESNFNKLLTALSHNSTIEYLSLVGTGPPDRATPATSELLSKFLESNTTLQFLDLSGYSGKLEDAHLGWGLSGALGGLKQNSTLRQLRIRNHDIGAAEDITELCRVIAANSSLAMLDIQSNNFDHHQFSKLVHALSHNGHIVSFPISQTDRDYALEKERQLFRKQLKKAPHKALSKSEEARLDGLLKWLRDHWDTEVKKATETLKRNRDYLTNQMLDLDAECWKAWEDDSLPASLRSSLSVRQRGKGTETTRSSAALQSGLFDTDTAESPTQPGVPGRHFSYAESNMKTYTIEEESSTSDSTPSPAIESPDSDATPVEEGRRAILPRTNPMEGQQILGRARTGSFTMNMMG
ncbi:hypothetical protein JX266_000857 [Neoarthrinium moseri]|nr:hypothetical protein JX266_000857 [Neoarthrinium moseri]